MYQMSQKAVKTNRWNSMQNAVGQYIVVALFIIHITFLYNLLFNTKFVEVTDPPLKGFSKQFLLMTYPQTVTPQRQAFSNKMHRRGMWHTPFDEKCININRLSNNALEWLYIILAISML
ncbi:hypothetical protein GDO78_008778 [Eleutherodactylus coqui]|uniref:Uncharacterized protein n=1 Tax=Eleutherodactylus coqui TaxID=57060 RepID=A0A8J6FDV2_ELECQ|nr:hypothetical protein GDO78_008778 [Eleutherodactylus coqui]